LEKYNKGLIVSKLVIVISKFLKRYSKAKRTRAPAIHVRWAYSRALVEADGKGEDEYHLIFPDYYIFTVNRKSVKFVGYW